jgi:hypothetical protein
MRVLTTLAAICLAGTASAQGNWDYRTTLYLWFPGLTASADTVHGTVEGEVSAQDALSNLQMGFMGTVAAQNGNWIVWGDLLYTDLAAETPTPNGVLWTEADIGQQLTAITSYVLYDVNPAPDAMLAFGGGARYFNLGVDVSLSGGSIGDAGDSIEETWTVPVLAAQFMSPINDSWFLAGTADWGMSGDESETWQVYGGVGYRFNERWSTQVGYRHMEFSRNAVEVGLDGVLTAVTYEF